MNKDFFLFNSCGYAINDKHSTITIAELNANRKDIKVVSKYRIPEMRVKLLVGTIKDTKSFIVVCSTEFNSDKQHVFIETRPINELPDLQKIYHIIKETYIANICNATRAISPKEKHST